MSIATGLTSTGNTQLSAFPIVAKYNYFSTVGASSGCILRPDLPVGTEVFIRNAGANTLNIYPSLGGTIEAGSVNASSTLATNSTARLHYAGNGNWFRSI